MGDGHVLGHGVAQGDATSASARCSPPASAASRSPSTCRRRSASTPTTRWPTGEVGKVGVPIDTLDDMVRAARRASSSTRSARSARRPTRSARSPSRCSSRPPRSSATRRTTSSVMLQNDVLKEYFARGTYIFPPAAGLRVRGRRRSSTAPATCRTGSRSSSAATTSATRGRRRCRSSPSRSPTASRTSTRRVRRGLDDRRRSRTRLYLFLSADLDIFEEAAKFRAARRMWADLMRERYGAHERRSLRGQDLRATRSAARRRPRSRSTTSCASPTRRSPRRSVACRRSPRRRTTRRSAAQRPGGRAARPAHAADPRLRDRRDPHAPIRSAARTSIERSPTRSRSATWQDMRRIEEHGGALAAIESGWLRREIDDVAYRTQLQIERGELAVVGVNRFEQADGDEEFEDDAEVADFEAEQRERLAMVRSGRDGSGARTPSTMSSTRHAGGTTPSRRSSVRCMPRRRSARSAPPSRRCGDGRRPRRCGDMMSGCAALSCWRRPAEPA